MAVTSVFAAGTKLAIETDYGSAPSGARNGKLWSQGGRWFDVITEGLPTIQDTQAMIFPAGHAGDRRMNQQAPVVGRQWTEGDFSAPIVADYLGVLLYAALGSLSTNAVPSTGVSILDKITLSAIGNQALSPVVQPGDGGAILRAELIGITGPGTLNISGIDAYGNGASESMTLNGAGTMYSRTSWSSISTSSGLSVAGLSAGTLTVIGVRDYVHNFTQASVAPTVSMERLNNPTVGEASANKTFINPGNVLKSLTLTINAEQVDGLATLQASWEGAQSNGASTKTTLNAPSMLRVWPSWALECTRDNGTTWNVITNVTLTINTGNTNYRSAAGVQGPQGVFFGATEYTGNITILLNNEVEYQKWRGASEIQMYWNMDTPWKLAGSTVYAMNASIPAYFNQLSVQDSDGKWALTGDFRVVRNDTFPFTMQVVNGTPNQAYGGTGI